MSETTPNARTLALRSFQFPSQQKLDAIRKSLRRPKSAEEVKLDLQLAVEALEKVQHGSARDLIVWWLMWKDFLGHKRLGRLLMQCESAKVLRPRALELWEKQCAGPNAANATNDGAKSGKQH